MRLLYFTLLFLFFLGPKVSQAQSVQTDKLAVKLLEKIEAEPEAFHSVHFVLADRVNLAALDAQLSAERATASKRAETVITALKDKAQQTQGAFLQLLENSPHVKPGSVRSFWINNVIFAEMQVELIADLSQRNDVEWIGLNGKLEMSKYEKAPPPPLPPVPNGREPGLGVIKAPALWAMGYTGYGQVAFTNDTGVDPTHPAIACHYRGLYVPKEETWYEMNPFTGQQSNNHDPYDCDAHGTHVTGTILGLNRLTNDTIGVAFNAKWIGAPILCGIGTADNVAAFQWSLDPDEDPTTTEDMPDIINNSWYDPSLQVSDCNSVYVGIEEAMEAAGIAVIFSAGNAGPGPMSITPPHNININEVSAFTVGAVNGNTSTLPIASFSSRGPSLCGGDSSILIKPEVSAPGVSVRSCIPGNTYDFFSGTSMAAPHVSGAILLLKEAFPELTGKELKTALYLTCTDLGQPGEDNIFGMGVIDVLAAFNYLVDQGHVPVSPFKANDVMIVDLQFPAFSCENEISPIIIVENAGTDSLFSFDVFYEAGAVSNTWQWTGVLAPRARVTLGLPALITTSGEHELKLELTNPNGVADERPLNNRHSGIVFVTSRERFHAQVEGTTTTCENTSALLRGEPSGNGSVDVKWFTAPTGGSPVGQGIAFETPPLAQTTTYYAEAIYNAFVGLPDNSVDEIALENEQEIGLVFEVHTSLTLKSVTVYADETGARILTLRDENGNMEDQAIAFINQTGEVTVELDWDIDEPGVYTIEKTLGKPLYHNKGGADYPYSIEGVIDITGTTNIFGIAGYWYYFYNWQVEYQEPCGRTPVVVEVAPGGNAPAASFTASADSVNIVENQAIQFTDGTAGATAWHWNFGDGATSDEANPSHTYTVPGTYVVSLSAANAEGCTGYALDTILVVSEEVNSTLPTPLPADNIAVFPNPVHDVLNVYLELKSAKPLRLYLTDMTGRVLKMTDYPSVQSESIAVDVTGLTAGVYFLQMELGEGKSVWKVVKL